MDRPQLGDLANIFSYWRAQCIFSACSTRSIVHPFFIDLLSTNDQVSQRGKEFQIFQFAKGYLSLHGALDRFSRW